MLPNIQPSDLLKYDAWRLFRAVCEVSVFHKKKTGAKKDAALHTHIFYRNYYPSEIIHKYAYFKVLSKIKKIMLQSLGSITSPIRVEL